MDLHANLVCSLLGCFLEVLDVLKHIDVLKKSTRFQRNEMFLAAGDTIPLTIRFPQCGVQIQKHISCLNQERRYTAIRISLEEENKPER